ncbi:hypothetical protein ABIS04_07145 [Shewanella sp. H8]|uniref:RHS repeat domain-containing protein n=1 Tax=Shewanella sp. H8 TaxID=3342676 RepID=UPI003315C026
MKNLLKGLLLAFLFFPLAGQSTETVRPTTDEPYTKLALDFELQMNDSAIFGEKIDFHHGNVGFEQTDLEASGNGIPIVVSRTFYSGAMYPFQAHLDFGDWALNIPSIQTTIITNASGLSSGDWSSGQECSGSPYTTSTIYQNGDAYKPEEYFDGITMLLGDGQKQTVIKNAAGMIESNTSTYPWVTNENWKFSCISRDNGAGEGFVGYSPNGLKITFNKSHLSNPRTIRKAHGVISKLTISLRASKIEDRFGNYIQYNYDTTNHLTNITANDGRIVTFTYAGNQIATMNYNGRVWNYTYAAGTLTSVDDPENQRWLYDLDKYATYNTYPTISNGGCGFDYSASIDHYHQTMDDIIASVTAPNGVKATYKFSPKLHGRSNVFYMDTGADDGSTLTKRCSANHALVQKTVTGPGLTPLDWTYDYSTNIGYFQGASITNGMRLTGTLPSNINDIDFNSSTETTPEDNVYVRYFDRKYDSVAEGSLVVKETYDRSGDVLEQIQYSFAQGNDVGQSFAAVYNESSIRSEYQLRPTQGKTIRYDGTNTDTYIQSNSSFDLYGFGAITHEYNDFSNTQRYVKQTYNHDVTNWLLGLPDTTFVSTDGSSYQPTKQTSYYSATSNYKSLPYQKLAFGRWYKQYDSYYTTGTQAGLEQKVSYNATNRWHQFSNYKRGIPQTIQTPQSLSTALQYAYNVVDNNGWVTKQTDFKGNCTNVTYDNLGRMTLFDPCDAALLNTTISYDYTSSSEGYANVETGMLKQTVKTGNHLQDSYFDAFVRPVFVSERDITKSDTIKLSAKSYDSMNNVTFVSYILDDGDITKGIDFTFDALGQQISATDNTISATQTFNYVNGNKIVHVDFNGNSTTNTYLAYAVPSYESETQIDSPESVDTSIIYNEFGNITSISQGGAVESHVYDAYQQLCKIIRPEYGAFSYRYDALAQLSYEGKGNSISIDTNSCDTVISSTDKVSYSYDNLGNIRTVNYGDSTPDLTYSYDKNNNPLSISASSFTQSFSYNSQNKPTTETTVVSGKTMNVSYSYDNYGNMTSITYPNGYKVTLAPDAMGYHRSVQRASNSYASALNYATGIVYHAAGMPSQFTYGNGIVQTVDVNDRNMPVAMKASSTTLVALDHSYDYDDGGNVSRYLDNRNSRYSLNSLSYDGLDRLKSISGGSFIGNISVNYDTLSNITQYNSLNSNLSYHYDTSKNRLSSITGTGAAAKSYSSFSYDARGNIGNNSYRGFTYNLAGQMTQSGSYSYIYDAQNRRIKQVDSKGTSYSFYSKAGKLLYRETPSGGTNYVYLNDKLIAKDGTGNTNTAALSAPTASMTCNPSSCQTTKTGSGTASITLTLSKSCPKGCETEWYYTGHSIFNNTDGVSPKTFSYYCRNVSESKTGTVGAIITDNSTGLTTKVSKSLTITCKVSGGGIEL